MNQMKPTPAGKTAKRPNRAAMLMAARQWHSYLAAFFAPAILFFAVTGAFQTFNLHKPAPGYQPPALLQALASMHKNQNLHVKYVDAAGAKAAKPDKAPDRGPDNAGGRPRKAAAPPAAAAQIMLKIFAALVSVGLTATTLLGLYMAWFTGRRWTVMLWFAAGLVLPMVVMLAI
jgi:hypothetical protein